MADSFYMQDLQQMRLKQKLQQHQNYEDPQTHKLNTSTGYIHQPSSRSSTPNYQQQYIPQYVQPPSAMSPYSRDNRGGVGLFPSKQSQSHSQIRPQLSLERQYPPQIPRTPTQISLIPSQPQIFRDRNMFVASSTSHSPQSSQLLKMRPLTPSTSLSQLNPSQLNQYNQSQSSNYQKQQQQLQPLSFNQVAQAIAPDQRNSHINSFNNEHDFVTFDEQYLEFRRQRELQQQYKQSQSHLLSDQSNFAYLDGDTEELSYPNRPSQIERPTRLNGGVGVSSLVTDASLSSWIDARRSIELDKEAKEKAKFITALEQDLAETKSKLKKESQDNIIYKERIGKLLDENDDLAKTISSANNSAQMIEQAVNDVIQFLKEKEQQKSHSEQVPKDSSIYQFLGDIVKNNIEFRYNVEPTQSQKSYMSPSNHRSPVSSRSLSSSLSQQSEGARQAIKKAAEIKDMLESLVQGHMIPASTRKQPLPPQIEESLLQVCREISQLELSLRSISKEEEIYKRNIQEQQKRSLAEIDEVRDIFTMREKEMSSAIEQVQFEGEDRINSLQNELANYTQKIDELEKNLEEQNSKISTAMEDLKISNQKLNSKNEEIEELKICTSNLEKQLAVKISEEKTNNNTTTQNESRRNSKTSFVETNRSLDKTNDHSQSDVTIQMLRDQIIVLTTSLNSATAQLQNSQIQQLLNALSENISQIKNQNDQVKYSPNRYEARDASSDPRIEQFQKYQRLQIRLGIEQEELLVLIEKLPILESELQKLAQVNEKLHEDLENETRKCGEYAASTVEWQRKHQALVNNLQEIQVEIDEERSSQMANYNQVIEQNMQLRQQIDRIQDRFESSKANLLTSQMQIASLQAENQYLGTKYDQSNSQRNMISDQQQQLSQLRDDNLNLSMNSAHSSRYPLQQTNQSQQGTMLNHLPETSIQRKLSNISQIISQQPSVSGSFSNNQYQQSINQSNNGPLSQLQTSLNTLTNQLSNQNLLGNSNGNQRSQKSQLQLDDFSNKEIVPQFSKSTSAAMPLITALAKGLQQKDISSQVVGSIPSTDILRNSFSRQSQNDDSKSKSSGLIPVLQQQQRRGSASNVLFAKADELATNVLRANLPPPSNYSFQRVETTFAQDNDPNERLTSIQANRHQKYAQLPMQRSKYMIEQQQPLNESHNPRHLASFGPGDNKNNSNHMSNDKKTINLGQVESQQRGKFYFQQQLNNINFSDEAFKANNN